MATLTVPATIRPEVLTFGQVQPLAGAVLAGMCAGLGLLGVFRHRRTRLAVDAVVFTLTAFTLPLGAVLHSLAGALVMNRVMAINHRWDWYVGM